MPERRTASAPDTGPAPVAHGHRDARSAQEPPDRPLRVLVTGFGPFPGMADNPSAALACALGERPARAGLELRTTLLPTTWAQAMGFSETLAADDPDLVVMLGVAARRRTLCVETVAFAQAGPHPDAEGRSAGPFPEGGPEQLSCAADAGALVDALREAGLPARSSRDAGRYICNALAYAAYRHAEERSRPLRAIFVHIPMPNAGTRSIDAMVRGLEALIAALAAQARAARPAGAPAIPAR